MDLVYKGGPTHCVRNALGGWLKSAFDPIYGGYGGFKCFVSSVGCRSCFGSRNSSREQRAAL